MNSKSLEFRYFCTEIDEVIGYHVTFEFEKVGLHHRGYVWFDFEDY